MKNHIFTSLLIGTLSISFAACSQEEKTNPYASGTPNATAWNKSPGTLKTCGNVYSRLKTNDLLKGRTWPRVLQDCLDNYAQYVDYLNQPTTSSILPTNTQITVQTGTPVVDTTIQQVPVQEVKETQTEKWTSGEEVYDERLPRKVKFEVGDVVCFKGNKKMSFVVFDIAPDWDIKNQNYKNNYYKYQTTYFNKNEEFIEKSFYEYEIVKCDGDK